MPGLRISVTDARGRAMGRHGLAGWLAGAAPKSARGRLAVALVSDQEIRRLNKRYRGVDRTTDVLSFPTDPEPEAPELPFLGDIAIATGVARRQARAQGHAFTTELRVLALHGLLHLLGYDHDADRGRMRKVEERLRRRTGLPSGLIARRSTRPANERTRVSSRDRSGESVAPAGERAGEGAGANPPRSRARSRE